MSDKESISANDIIAEVDAQEADTPETPEAESVDESQQPQAKTPQVNESLEEATEESESSEQEESNEQEDLSGEENSADIADAQEAVSEAEDIVNDSDIPEEDKDAAKAEIAQRIYKAKILGEEKQFDVSNPEDVKELLDGYQKGVAAYEKFEEAAKLRKQSEAESERAKEFLRLLKEDLPSLLAHPDLDLDSEYVKGVAEKILAGKIEEEFLTPEQKRIRELESELERQKAESEEIKKSEEQAKLEEASKNLATEWENQIMEVLPKYKLPSSPKTVLQMIDYMERAKAIGYSQFSWDDAAKRVRKDFVDWQNEIYGSVKDDDLDHLVPNKVKERVRKSTVSKAKQSVKKPAAANTKSVSSSTSKPDKPKKLHMSDFLNEVYKEAGLNDD